MRTAETLLRITRPEDLFTGDPDKAKQQWRALAQEWHPDRNASNPRASEVFAHVSSLYDTAVDRLAKGLWEGEGFLKLTTKSGSPLSVTYLRKASFELGSMYVGEDHVTYLVDPQHKGLFDNAEKLTHKFKYASDRMEKEISRYLPKGVGQFELKDKRLGMRVPKSPDMLLLRDVLNFYGGALDPKHVAWIQSSLQNLACYLSHAGIVHHNISPDTYFISPEFHSGALLGGWWYAAKQGTTISRVPTRTHEYLPFKVRHEKKAYPQTDLELILATGRELLGDITGTKLLKGKTPKEMVAGLRVAASDDAVNSYKQWMVVLKDSFGARRFTKMDLNAVVLYAKK